MNKIIIHGPKKILYVIQCIISLSFAIHSIYLSVYLFIYRYSYLSNPVILLTILKM